MLLDRFLPVYHFNEAHTIVVQGSTDRVFSVIKDLTVAELSPVVHMLFAIRGLPGRLSGETGLAANSSETMLEQLYRRGFVPLAEDGDRELVVGTVGQFWKLSGGRNLRLLDSEEFLCFSAPGYVKVATNLCLSESTNGRVNVSTESRIFVPEPSTRRKFAPYWWLVRPGSGLIRRMCLKAIKRRAERSQS